MKSEKIYIVDDDLFYAGVIADFLESKGYPRPKTFSTGEYFLDNLYTLPQIVILDINLPNINGVSILRRIKSFDPDIYVVMLSGQNDVVTAVNSLKYGAFDYMIKDEAAFKNLLDIIRKIEQINSLRKKSYFSALWSKPLRKRLAFG